MMVTVSCPDCLRSREVDDSVASRIRTGKKSGRCQECSLAVQRLVWAQTSRTRVAERLWTKVTRNAECWIWTGAKTNQGYGKISVGSKIDKSNRLVLVHRLAYELLVGPIPTGLMLDHLCVNPACVNPEHLEPVTNRENLRRGVKRRAVTT